MQNFDQNKDEMSTKFATTVKSGSNGQLSVPKISLGVNNEAAALDMNDSLVNMEYLTDNMALNR